MQSATSARDLDVARIPTPGLIADYATQRITAAARTLWPTAALRLGHIIASVTSHVQQIDVNDRTLYAKVELLGASMVSVLRGAFGDWPTVRAAQAAYLASPGTVLEREANQLRALAAAGLRVPAVAGRLQGVLFTEHVQGPSLAELITATPSRTAGLLQQTAREVDSAMRQPDLVALVDRAPMVERSIVGTFMRKFNGISGPTYLLGTQYGEALSVVVSRLRSAHAEPSPALARPIVFGDLKPEHVLFPPGERPVFIDPGLMRGPLCTDPAKLMSRLVLGLVGRPPAGDDVRLVLDGITASTRETTAHMHATDESAWRRQALVLWLMDTTNILTTYLNNPRDLPLTEQATAVVARAWQVCGMLDRATAALSPRRSTGDTWDCCLAEAAAAALR
ncbi:hypothetical protein ACGFR8_21360 [Streptomyces brevispora]|uniref:hypothetical protein n=1 Tax=Streptomyces brevispora TaxID=887462 RepID=UPI00372261E6